MPLLILFAVLPFLPGWGCSNPPVPVNVAVEVLDEALDVVDTARPLDVAVEVTLMTGHPRDVVPQTTITQESTVEGTNGALITLQELLEPCAITGDGGTLRVIVDGNVSLAAPLELDDDEKQPATPHPNSVRCAYDGVSRSFRVHPTANLQNLALERL